MTYFWYFLGYGFLGYLLEKLFAALTATRSTACGRAFCSRPSARVRILQCAPCSRWARIASAALGARAALQHHRNDGGIRRSSFLRRRARRALLGLQRDKNGRQRPYLSAVLARVGRARCARRAPRAARAGGSRRWHSVHRDEHRAALPRHRRAVEHRRAARWGDIDLLARAACGGNTGRYRKKRGLCPRFSFNRYAARSTPTDRRRPARGSPRSISRGAGRDRSFSSASRTPARRKLS